MFTRLFLAVAALGMTAFATPGANARPRDKEQDTAFKATQQGRFLSLPEIESRIVPRMRGSRYIRNGVELDARSARYRLKFMRGPQLIWVDVDARSGEVVGRAGN